jgi:enterobactin synthetase component D
MPVTPFIRSTEIAELAPHPGVLVATCRFAVEDYDDGLFELLSIPRPEFLDRAVRKRRAEYLAGRACAASALARIGSPERTVGTGSMREPLFPAGLLGSISHVEGRACAAVAFARDYRFLGIDLQSVVTASEAAQLFPSIADPEERRMLVSSLGDEATAFTLAMSIKESFFKAVSRHVGRYFDFTDVRVEAVDATAGEISIRILNPLTSELRPGLVIGGWFDNVDEGTFRTWIAVRIDPDGTNSTLALAQTGGRSPTPV